MKKRKNHGQEDATADKTIDVASEQPQNPPSKVNSPQEDKGGNKSRDNSQPEAQTHTEGPVPEKSADEKKVKKRKKEKMGKDGLPKQSGATEETTAQRELLAPDADEKNAKKRKHKEKQVDGAPPKQGDATQEATAQLEPVAQQVEVKEKRKKKSKEAKASVDGAALTATANVIAEEGATVKKRKDTESVENDGEKPKRKRRRSKAEKP